MRRVILRSTSVVGNVKESFSEAMCEGLCGEDSAKACFNEGQRNSPLMAMRG